ncbi:hypothetical protein EVAR_59294_1 [Eumeta japonica]|uniref:Uncharacterized protein n=1 Tax=Eumeta variegata TaxID=151549 RepID=A0A4C1YBR9_EUMVA|nr:hypothetical protein EVAR_59294_1 [Eumeta japonica]
MSHEIAGSISSVRSALRPVWTGRYVAIDHDVHKAHLTVRPGNLGSPRRRAGCHFACLSFLTSTSATSGGGRSRAFLCSPLAPTSPHSAGRRERKITHASSVSHFAADCLYVFLFSHKNAPVSPINMARFGRSVLPVARSVLNLTYVINKLDGRFQSYSRRGTATAAPRPSLGDMTGRISITCYSDPRLSFIFHGATSYLPRFVHCSNISGTSALSVETAERGAARPIERSIS